MEDFYFIGNVIYLNACRYKYVNTDIYNKKIGSGTLTKKIIIHSLVGNWLKRPNLSQLIFQECEMRNAESVNRIDTALPVSLVTRYHIYVCEKSEKKGDSQSYICIM